MPKTIDLMDEDVDVNEAAGIMGGLDSELGPCPCCSEIPKPHYKAGTPKARRAAANATAFILETAGDGNLFINRSGHAFRLEEDGSTRERIGRVRDFIDVPVKDVKARKKNRKAKVLS